MICNVWTIRQILYHRDQCFPSIFLATLNTIFSCPVIQRADIWYSAYTSLYCSCSAHMHRVNTCKQVLITEIWENKQHSWKTYMQFYGHEGGNRAFSLSRSYIVLPMTTLPIQGHTLQSCILWTSIALHQCIIFTVLMSKMKQKLTLFLLTKISTFSSTLVNPWTWQRWYRGINRRFNIHTGWLGWLGIPVWVLDVTDSNVCQVHRLKISREYVGVLYPIYSSFYFISLGFFKGDVKFRQLSNSVVLA